MVIIEIETQSDEDIDSAWPFSQATAAFIAKVLGLNVSVTDGTGTFYDYDREGNEV